MGESATNIINDNTVISIKELKKSFDTNVVLNGIDIDI